MNDRNCSFIGWCIVDFDGHTAGAKAIGGGIFNKDIAFDFLPHARFMDSPAVLNRGRGELGGPAFYITRGRFEDGPKRLDVDIYTFLKFDSDAKGRAAYKFGSLALMRDEPLKPAHLDLMGNMVADTQRQKQIFHNALPPLASSASKIVYDHAPIKFNNTDLPTEYQPTAVYERAKARFPSIAGAAVSLLGFFVSPNHADAAITPGATKPTREPGENLLLDAVDSFKRTPSALADVVQNIVSLAPIPKTFGNFTQSTMGQALTSWASDGNNMKNCLEYSSISAQACGELVHQTVPNKKADEPTLPRSL